MASAKWRPFYLSPNVLNINIYNRSNIFCFLYVSIKQHTASAYALKHMQINSLRPSDAYLHQ